MLQWRRISSRSSNKLTFDNAASNVGGYAGRQVIVLFTDFGSRSPYVAQLHAILLREAPGVSIIDLLHDAPAHNPRAGAYLLAAYINEFPVGFVCLTIIDPGVGGDRDGIIVNADGRWLVGPQNGLLDRVLLRSRSSSQCWRITWQPPNLSASFHGRDLFAPVAGRIAAGHSPSGELLPNDGGLRHPEWPDDVEEVVYVDHFGNAITGI